jgi:hypothetical protein
LELNGNINRCDFEEFLWGSCADVSCEDLYNTCQPTMS